MDNNFREDYETIWESFAKEISGLTKELMTHAEQAEEGRLHAVLQSLQNVPYDKAPNMFNALSEEIRVDDDKKRSNVGSMTGVFFELAVASLVTGYIRRHFQKDAKVEFNTSGILREFLKGSKIRDADILVSYQNRYVVFETKASPKKNELEGAKHLYKTYTELNRPTKFFLIGGHVNASSEAIKELKEWACYTSSSPKNTAMLETYTLDNVLKEAVRFLRNQ